MFPFRFVKTPIWRWRRYIDIESVMSSGYLHIREKVYWRKKGKEQTEKLYFYPQPCLRNRLRLCKYVLSSEMNCVELLETMYVHTYLLHNKNSSIPNANVAYR